MSSASRSSAGRAPWSGVTIHLVLALVLGLALLAGRAQAAQSTSAAGTAAADLCSAARSVASDIVNSTSTLAKGTVAPGAIKTVYLKIKAAEPSLLSAANGSLKTDLTQVFGYLNVLIADLEKANWNIVALAPQFKTLEAQGLRVQKPMKALSAYFTHTCKLKA